MGAPPTIAGIANTGSASAVPICRIVDAVRAAAASPPSTPVRCSITTVNGVADPGRILPTALPASCAVATGNHALEPSAMRSSSHRQTELAPSRTNTSTAYGQSRCARDGHDEKTARRLGRTR
jgi:hypothetical protein